MRLPGVIVTERKLFELDAISWNVYSQSELVFSFGPEIVFGNR